MKVIFTNDYRIGNYEFDAKRIDFSHNDYYKLELLNGNETYLGKDNYSFDKILDVNSWIRNDGNEIVDYEALDDLNK